MRATHIVMSLVLTIAMLFLTVMPAQSATPEQIVAAIDNGVAWLVANQNADGSWGNWEQVAKTAFAVVKLQDRARELGTDEYDAAIQAGLDYIFGNATINPYGVGTGLCFNVGGHETYTTGIAMMAIADDLGKAVNTGPAAGWTHGAVLQANVNFFVYTQNPADGGWRYYGDYPGDSDQSNTGYAVLGLGYARAAGLDVSFRVTALSRVGWYCGRSGSCY